MTSGEKIAAGAELLSEGFMEILGKWAKDMVSAAYRLAEAIGDSYGDEMTLLNAYVGGLISPRAYSVAQKGKGSGKKGRRYKKWVNASRRKLGKLEKLREA